jgi:glycosyltransferase involved in cell wall biosynthesis
MNHSGKIPVSLFIGEKNFVQKGSSETKTGYKRHYESEFFTNLKMHVDFEVHHLYPFRGKKYSALRHFLNHLWHPIKFKNEFKKDRIKHIMFAEEAFMLNFLPCEKTVVSCLDVIPLVLPNEASAKYRRFLSWAYKGMKKASTIIANSEYTKKDIVKHLDIPEDKISVAYPPVQDFFKEDLGIPGTFYTQYSLNPNAKYLLSVGALDLPRKNVKTILEAFAKFHKEYKAAKLLLVGYTTLKGNLDKLNDQISKLGIGDAVQIITNVPDLDLVAFYNLASIFLFPSLYEGFGLPPLEAMACGTPVIASHVSSIPEVLGDAAVFVDPLDADEIARQIEMLMMNEKLREEKIQQGFRRAERYSWKNYCDSTLETYKKIWK